LFSEHCDSFDNIFVNDTIINQQDTILADFFCAETDLYFSNTGTYQIRDSYESFYKKNRNQAKGFLSGCLSKNYSYYIKDANIYIAQMGSIYADKLQKSRSGSLSPHPEDVYLSKGVCFWDKILYFNPPKGDLFYYAPLKLEFFYDNVLDTAQAIAFPILVNTPQKTLQESERSAKHIPSYYDPNTQILYFINEHTPKKISLNAIKIQPK
jgi:hypothetical protein